MRERFKSTLLTQHGSLLAMVPRNLTWILNSEQHKTEREHVIRHGTGSHTVGMKAAFGKGAHSVLECQICYISVIGMYRKWGELR